MTDIRIIDRKNNKEIVESEFSSNFISFLYHSMLGRVLLTFIFARPYFSYIMGLYYKNSISRHRVRPFIKKYKLDPKLLNRNFEDFFSRKENVKIQREQNAFYATAEGKLRAFKIGEDGNLYAGDKRVAIRIKGNDYSMEKLLKSSLPKWAIGGYLLLYRLSMSDYHRYIYPVKGYCIRNKKIKGKLESVRKDAAYWRAFVQNKRELEYWETKLGKIIHIDIGAMLVGHIHNHKKKYFSEGEEKGYFSFGGSSIVEIVNSKVEIDADILKNTERGFETKIKIGERIAYGKTEKA